jgi:hypothetical protein
MFAKLSGETLLYPIIGDPIVFVKSPQRLSAEFEARNHNGICVPMQVPEGELESVISGLGRIPNVRGLLITMPHKNSMFAHCATSTFFADHCSGAAPPAAASPLPPLRRLPGRRHAGDPADAWDGPLDRYGDCPPAIFRRAIRRMIAKVTASLCRTSATPSIPDRATTRSEVPDGIKSRRKHQAQFA